MKAVLKKFITEPLFDASAAMLEHLQIQFTPQSRTPLAFTDLYPTQLPQALAQVVDKVEHIYLIGAIDEESLAGRQSDFDIEKPLEGKYATMLVFAVDMKSGANLTRTELATLTRGFNRMAPQLPVILFVKNGYKLTLATCERSEYKQEWRSGEKLGKVSILRDIDCNSPHRGHLDILDSLGDKAYPTFDELYDHWFEVFSSKLLTKKFYTELSEWYAWVIGSGKVKFPNDLTTTDDDAKYNHEAVIRLITRLIFVWFLKQKHLIPEEFFDEDYIRENFIENFDPNLTDSVLYDPSESKYYRLILQNLFFAMLNRPIKDEKSGNEENRRFATSKRYHGISPDHNVNNLLRYRSEFAPGGADLLLSLANSKVPFLNGGLFECLDDKDNKLYYDGFSEHPASLDQLSFPDYFFFGEEVGNDVDLSAWYDDSRKKHVHVRGLINILKNYHFTVEENTPLDQEVSLDPELLGKVFENLLASYNPETKTSARNQTGSFYTPREIVQYMVDESIISYLNNACPDIAESTIRSVLSYDDSDFSIDEDNARKIIRALYGCKVLDPACGSGAFPVGVLQQMVHILRKLDSTNEIWREFVLNIALEKDKQAYGVENEAEKSLMRQDIEQSFDKRINDPDYARKLYLIENCIYGVDIQPIAIQICKLRFFISLVAEQNPTADALHNFGIRPLPNLEAKFVAANTLIPLDSNDGLFASTTETLEIKKQLAAASHKLFTVKRKAEKERLRNKIASLRDEYAQELLSMGVLDTDNAMKFAKWDLFKQNEAAPFFTARWMFDIETGFDIVIGNPPYISAPAQIASKELTEQRNKIIECKRYKTLYQKWDLYIPFMEFSLNILREGGAFSMIVPFPLSNQLYGQKFRKWVTDTFNVTEIANLNGTKIFENATVFNLILFAQNTGSTSSTYISHINNDKTISRSFEQPIHSLIQDPNKCLWNFTQEERKISSDSETNILGDFCYISKGMVLNADEKAAKGEFQKEDLISDVKDEIHPREYIEAKDIDKYMVKRVRYLEYNTSRCPDQLSRPTFRELYEQDKIVMNCLGCINCTIDNSTHFLHNHSIYCAILWRDLKEVDNKSIKASVKRYSRLKRGEMQELSEKVCLEYLMALMNSRYSATILAKLRGDDYHIYPEHIRNFPIPLASEAVQKEIKELVNQVLVGKEAGLDTSDIERKIDIYVYNIYNLTYEEVLIVDPETSISKEEYENFSIE